MRFLSLASLILLAIGVRASDAAEAHRPAAPHAAWKQSLKTIQAEAHAKSVASHAEAKASAGRVHASLAARSYPGSPYTITNLIARVETNPQRFAAHHGVHTAVILERDIQLRAMIAQGKCIPKDGLYQGGLLAQTPYHRYLEYRRSLNPARFDSYHKVLGPILAEDARIRAISMACNCGANAGETLTPPGSPSGTTSSGNGDVSGIGLTNGTPSGNNNSGGGTTTGPGGGPPAVPAPAGLVLMAFGSASLMIGKGMSACRRARPI